MKRIAVLTSGGDSPGMNACIRAVVRAGIYYKLEVFGIYRGYEGLIDDEISQLRSFDVSNIIQRGGTILKSARSERFKEKKWREQAFKHLQKRNIDGLVVIGGDGTFTGAAQFHKETHLPVIGAPGTIDNDLFGTDYTIGYDTALNTVIDAVDKIRDTASSHNRLFFVEVMGRDAGFIALRSGISTGAEAILIPETTTYIDKLIQQLDEGYRNKKSSGIIIVAEGDEAGGAYKIAEKVKKRFHHYDIRVTVLGHVQRGGSPSALDRVLASNIGLGCVEALLEGESNLMVGVINNAISHTSFEKSIKYNHDIKPELLQLAEILSIS